MRAPLRPVDLARLRRRRRVNCLMRIDRPAATRPVVSFSTACVEAASRDAS
jgi:hypothetical protein